MNRCIYLIALLMAISSCATLPKNMADKDTKIVAVGPGPEDMVLDTITEQPRLLISCHARRTGDPYYSEINVYYPGDGSVKILKRVGEPSDLYFGPHGIDLVKVKDTLILLVVNHNMAKHENSILRYQVKKDELVFLSKITDPLIVSPNAVTGFADGTLLISNDAGKQGDFTEALFLLKRDKIIYWDHNKCSVAAQKFCFANGITNSGGKVYLVSTRQNKLWQFDFVDGKMLNKKTIAAVPGADNVRICDGNLYVACHLRFLDFLKHMKAASHFSPTTVYRINPGTGLRAVVFYDDGAKISAGSTGFLYKDKIYVSGVFDGKLAIANVPYIIHWGRF